MNPTEWAQVSKVAQEGFDTLLQELQTAGATERQALTIILGHAQLKAHLAGIMVENTSLPGETQALMN